MKKQKLFKKLQLKKSVISSLGAQGITGGTNSVYRCDPIDLSKLETCLPGCEYTLNCETRYRTCNDNGNGNGNGGNGNNSGGISCPGYQC